MPKTFEPESHPEPGYKPEATANTDLQPTLRVKRALIVGTVLLALMAGSAPVADAATAKGDSSVQNKRICWFSRC